MSLHNRVFGSGCRPITNKISEIDSMGRKKKKRMLAASHEVGYFTAVKDHLSQGRERTQSGLTWLNFYFPDQVVKCPIALMMVSLLSRAETSSLFEIPSPRDYKDADSSTSAKIHNKDSPQVTTMMKLLGKYVAESERFVMDCINQMESDSLVKALSIKNREKMSSKEKKGSKKKSGKENENVAQEVADEVVPIVNLDG